VGGVLLFPVPQQGQQLLSERKGSLSGQFAGRFQAGGWGRCLLRNADVEQPGGKVLVGGV